MLRLTASQKWHLAKHCKNVRPVARAYRNISNIPAQAPIATAVPQSSDLKHTDEHLRMIFDNNTIWNQERNAASNSGFLTAFRRSGKSTASVGLFNNPSFATAAGFEQAASDTIERAELIVERIWRSPENGESEMRKVVKNLDRLSDTLCCVIDMAEFIRNAHPDANIMEAANNAYSRLCSYMNTLNTDTRLHKVNDQFVFMLNMKPWY